MLCVVCHDQPLACWNFFLAFASLYLWVWILREVWWNFHATVAGDVWEMTCDHRTRLASSSLVMPMYVTFLTKYVEFVDTFFLCVRNKPTPFIHVYHHAITVYFAWSVTGDTGCKTQQAMFD